jgi:hypothetical protein
MAIKRIKRLSKDEDLSAKNVEDIFNELADQVPTKDDYRQNLIEEKTLGTKIPPDMKTGEIRFDFAASTPYAYTLRIVNGVKKKYKINDLTEIT